MLSPSAGRKKRRNDMQYIALIYSARDAGPTPGSDEFNKMMAGYFACTEAFKKDGVFVAGDPLEGTDQSTTLRKRSGKLETMDGPFAETKEQLGGYYIFECANLDDAIRYAEMIPTVEFGSVEVRPIMKMG